MFSTEFNFEDITITLLDETGEYEDVQVYLEDDVVYIRQFSENENEDKPADLVVMTPKMFRDLIEAMGLPEGFYVTKYSKGG
jgi:hypothetical protein